MFFHVQKGKGNAVSPSKPKLSHIIEFPNLVPHSSW